MLNGKQCTIAWYVDDCKISHVDSKVVSWVIEKIEEKHGKMTVTRGKKHTFVGIDFELLEDGNVKIYMKDYIKEIVSSFQETSEKKFIFKFFSYNNALICL